MDFSTTWAGSVFTTSAAGVPEAVAETEEEALELVQQGHGFQESFTHDLSAPGEFELYDTEDPAEWDEKGFPKTEK